MTDEAHEARAVGLRMYDAFNGRNLAALEEVLAPDFVSHPLRTAGIGAVADAWSKMFAAHPDIQVSVEDMLVDHDRVAVRSVLQGLSDSVPSGTEPAPTMMEIFRVQGGRIAELWGLSSLGRPAGWARIGLQSGCGMGPHGRARTRSGADGVRRGRQPQAPAGGPPGPVRPKETSRRLTAPRAWAFLS
ncbi:ester cyclase [Streptomyces anandii]|uniref:ester cyclase n=1 Tax=Streptomyces anandii TaxID=285454 RepID=UPI0037AC65D2